MNRIKLILIPFLLLLFFSTSSPINAESEVRQPHRVVPTVRPLPTIRPLPKITERLNNRPSFSRRSIKQEEQAELKAESILTPTVAPVYVDQSYTGSSDGLESKPYKDIYTAITSSNIDPLTLYIKPGTYDEFSHDLLGAVKVKTVIFKGILTEKPLIKAELISCGNKSVSLSNIKLKGKETAANCADGADISFEDAEITSDSSILFQFKDNGNLLLIESQATGSIVGGEHFVLTADKTNIQGSLTATEMDILLMNSILSGDITSDGVKGIFVQNNSLIVTADKTDIKGKIRAKGKSDMLLMDGSVGGPIEVEKSIILTVSKENIHGSFSAGGGSDIFFQDGSKIFGGITMTTDEIFSNDRKENLILTSDTSTIDGVIKAKGDTDILIMDGSVNGSIETPKKLILTIDNVNVNGGVSAEYSDFLLRDSKVTGSLVLTGEGLVGYSGRKNSLLLTMDKSSIGGSISSNGATDIFLRESTVSDEIKATESPSLQPDQKNFILTANKSKLHCQNSSDIGISAGKLSDVFLVNTLLYGCSNALKIGDGSFLTLDLVTIANITSDAILIDGLIKPRTYEYDDVVYVSDSLFIQNSIFSDIGGYVVNLKEDSFSQDPKPKATIYYNDFWQTQDLNQNIKNICSECHDNYNKDPLFVNSRSGDFHLLPNSPAIDVGNPSSDYSQESLPNGGRVDLGAYGNTPEATSKAAQKLPVIFIPGTFGTKLNLQNANEQCNGEIWLDFYKWAGALNIADINKINQYKSCLKALSPGNNGDGFLFDEFKTGTINPFGLIETIPANIIGGYPKQTSDFYNSFINKLNTSGWPAQIRVASDPLFFIFYYDWRLSIVDNSNKLNNYIDEVLSNVNKSSNKDEWLIKQVNLIGHSQGGIVARQLVASNLEGSKKIKKIIYVGTPFYGVIQVLENLEYGPSDLMGINIPSKLSPIIGNMLHEAIGNMPSLNQLLPSKNYEKVYPNFFSIDGESFNYDVFTQWIYDNHNKNIFNWVQPVHQLDDPDKWNIEAKNIEQYFLIGTELSTPAKIEEKTSKLFDNIIIEHKIIPVFGDGTVTAGSAQWLLLNNNPKFEITRFFFPKVSHPIFLSYSQVQNCILDILGNSSNSSLTRCPSYSNRIVNGKLISVHSPIRISVFDSEGSHTGYTEDGAVEMEIPESTFTVLGEEQFLFLPNNPEDYKIDLIPTTDNGEFTLQIEGLSSDENGVFNPIKSILFNSVPITSKNQLFTSTFSGSSDVGEIKLTSKINQEQPKIIEPDSIVGGEFAKDNDSPTSTIILNGEEGQEKWFKSKVEITINSQDLGSGILETLYSLDGLKQKYLNPFIVENEGKHNLEATSVDKIGNWQLNSTIVDFGIDLQLPEIDIEPNKSVYKKSDTLKASYTDNLSGIDKSIIKLDDKLVDGNVVTLNESGKHTLFIEVSDKAGNVTQKQYEFTVVEYNILINNNDEFTNNRNTKLTLIYPDGTEKVRIDDRPFSNNDRIPLWQNTTQSKNWFLKGADGDKTVYAQFKDELGKVSDVISDSIILDTRPPRGRVKIIRNNNTNQVILSIDASDNSSGISQMMVSNNMAFSGAAWQPYSKQIEWTLNPIGGPLIRLAYVFVRFKDGAGNVSILAMDWILIR